MTATTKKILLALLVVAAVAAYFTFDLGQFFTLDYIKASQTRFAAFYADNSALTIAAYMLIYVVTTALSLPGATVLTLGGAALFGFWTALVAVSFASTMGATLACAAARFVFRGPVQRRFADKLAPINKGVQKEGAFYLFTLRLIPVFPFFAINLAMGLTPIRLRTFYWVSQLGMLPGTAVYINAGTQLGRIESLSGILSPSLILSFALLGLFPLVAKKAIPFLRNRLRNR